jgi:prepilin-type N-terminal cleavage/methylation domain-containing protein
MIKTAFNQDGFSLVETLVALVLLSLISVYGLTSLYYFRAFNRVGQNTERNMNEEIALERIREVFSQFQFGAQGIENSLDFSGQPDSLSFLALSDGKAVPGGLYKVEFFKNESGDFALRWQSWPQQEGRNNQSEVTILNQAGEVQFSYAESSKVAAFLDVWVSKDSYPKTIKINFRNRSSGTALPLADVERMIILGSGY